KLLFVTPAFPPVPGGGEYYAHALATHLADRGHSITVVTSAARLESDFWQRSPAPPLPRQEERGGIHIVRCPLRPLPGGRWTLLAWRKAMVLLAALPGERPALLAWMARFVPALLGLDERLAALPGGHELVHGFNLSWEGAMMAAWRFARARRLPFVVTPFAHLGTGPADRVALNNRMDHQRQLLRDADATLTLTSVEKEGLVRWGAPAGRVEVVGSGLKPVPMVAADPEHWRRYGLVDPLVLFIGRVSFDKGAIHAAQAVMALRARGRPVCLALVGQIAPEFARFYRSLSAVDREYVRPLGLVSEHDKQTLLCQCVTLVLPSRTDSFGIVLLEAWAHGKPVIGARAGGIPGVVSEGEDGLLVDFGDVAALAAAVDHLLTDPALCERMGQKGQSKTAAHYTWERVTEQVLTIYQRLLVGHV
ncbi:MAG: glycosyltransferase family 4 protein, partial [Chloroflexota bacterium]